MDAAPITIDVETGTGYAGLGDLVTLAWLVEGCRQAGQRVILHRTRDPELLAILGLDIDPRPGGVTLNAAYAAELADRGRRPRLDYIRDQLGITAAPARPTLTIPAEHRAWAAERAAALGPRFVALFPQTAWRTREWPPSYWVDLAWGLKAAGVPSVVLIGNKDERFLNTPVFWWGTPLVRLTALLERAAVVVGNDSFPVHLAGTLGVPTIALLGPTKPTVFAHMGAGVECLASAAIDCTGCHFGPPFRAACDQGCLSLFRLFPEDILQRVLRAVSSRPAPA